MMATEVVIKMTWGKFVGAFVSAAAIFFGGVWIVGSVWLNDIKADVREIRSDIKEAHAENTTLRDILTGTGRDLAQKISETREIVASDKARLDSMDGHLNLVAGRVSDMQSEFKVLRGDVDQIKAAVGAHPR